MIVFRKSEVRSQNKIQNALDKKSNRKNSSIYSIELFPVVVLVNCKLMTGNWSVSS